MSLPDACTQCGQSYQTCKKCEEKIVFVPKPGFGNLGEWRHLEPVSASRGVAHMPHPTLVIT